MCHILIGHLEDGDNAFQTPDLITSLKINGITSGFRKGWFGSDGWYDITNRLAVLFFVSFLFYSLSAERFDYDLGQPIYVYQLEKLWRSTRDTNRKSRHR